MNKEKRTKEVGTVAIVISKQEKIDSEKADNEREGDRRNISHRLAGVDYEADGELC